MPATLRSGSGGSDAATPAHPVASQPHLQRRAGDEHAVVGLELARHLAGRGGGAGAGVGPLLQWTARRDDRPRRAGLSGWLNEPRRRLPCTARQYLGQARVLVLDAMRLVDDNVAPVELWGVRRRGRVGASSHVPGAPQHARRPAIPAPSHTPPHAPPHPAHTPSSSGSSPAGVRRGVAGRQPGMSARGRGGTCGAAPPAHIRHQPISPSPSLHPSILHPAIPVFPNRPP